MIYEMYSIKDELNGFTTPIPILSEEIAKRYFKEQMIINSTMKTCKEDFSIWKVGEFNEETAEYKTMEPKLIERGKNYE